MPASDQRYLRRWARGAINDGDRFLSNIHNLKVAFSPHHPEYLPLLDAIAQIIIMAQVAMGDFYQSAWGRKPDNDPRLD